MKKNIYFLLVLAIIVGTIPGTGLNKHFTAEAQTPWMGPMFGGQTYNWGGYGYGYPMSPVMTFPFAQTGSFGAYQPTIWGPEYIPPGFGGPNSYPTSGFLSSSAELFASPADIPWGSPWAPSSSSPPVNLGPPDPSDDPEMYRAKWYAWYFGSGRTVSSLAVQYVKEKYGYEGGPIPYNFVSNIIPTGSSGIGGRPVYGWDEQYTPSYTGFGRVY